MSYHAGSLLFTVTLIENIFDKPTINLSITFVASRWRKNVLNVDMVVNLLKFA